MLLEVLERAGEAAARCLEKLRIVMLSGDRISVRLLQRITRLKPGIRVLALGGATEVSIWTCYNWVEDLPPESGFVPYGVPLPNQSGRVLDSDMNEVPVGQTGTLYMGGTGVARGYRARPDLTAAAFIADPHRPGARWYATGDRVRRLPGGNLEFLGRQDHQVKIRGFRVETAEVERALLRLEEIEQAAVTCAQSPHGSSLIACVVLCGNAQGVHASQIRKRLSEWLPAYMVPERFHFLDTMPVNQNGKVDLKRLRDLDTPAAMPDVTDARALPVSGTTQSVLAIWQDVLTLKQISLETHFMDLGGNSLLASQIVNRLSEILPVHLEVRDVFENPTIAALAAAIDEQLVGPAGDPVSQQEPVADACWPA
jgi:surfactin family lipopeptide synthetase A/fengycin family lipopeptide synthetase D